MYEPLPFMNLNFKIDPLLFNQTDHELIFAFMPVQEKEWARILMNYPAYEKSELSYQYEPVLR